MTQTRGAAERTLPQNVEAECSLLGSIIIDPEALALVADFLRAEDFYRDAHSQIYEVMLHLYNQRTNADFITICDVLESQEKLEDVGGASYITSLINQVPTSGNALFYARIIERTAILRNLIRAAGQIAAMAYEAEDDAAPIVEQAEQLIFAISQHSLSLGTDASLEELLSSYTRKLDQLWQRRGSVVGVPTGFADLDRLTGGLRRSDLIVLAARPSQGKTSLALSLAYNAASHYHQRIGIFSVEMSQEQLVERLMAMDTGINLQRLSTGNIEDDEWERVVAAQDRLSDLPIRIDGTSVLSPMQMRSRARRWVVEYGLDLIIVDYLQLLQPSDASKRKIENRVLVIDEVTRNLKLLARELNLPILALAQLSRAVESRLSKVPQLSDLRESGCLTGETLIYLPDEGQHRRLDTLPDQRGFRVLALNRETWKLEPCPAINVFPTGHKPVYKLTTRLGRSIRATANHQFLTFDGWRRLDEIACGMRLALPRMLLGTEMPTMTHEELALLGHLIGDGCTLARQTMHYTTVELDLAEEVVRLAAAVFGTKIAPQIQWQTPRERKGEWYQVYLPASYPLTHGVHTPIASWLRNMGVFGLRSHEKYVPCCVFAQPIEGIACFLRHLWSTDGHAALSKERAGRRIPRIFYASSSERLAKDVQSLLLRLGINARVKRVPQGVRGRDQYHVQISGRPDVGLFIEQVGTVGRRKRDALDQIRLHITDRVANTNRDALPPQVWRQIAVPAMVARGMTTRQMQAALGNAYCGTALYKSALGRDRATRLASIVRSTELALLAQSDVYWDEVVTIESDGVEEVYDLTVDGLHNFVANNMVVHNSIEQNADIVMFIYRDEVYTPTTQRRGIADIIVAKHRNGPTGTFCLEFEAQTTRFRDPRDEAPPVSEVRQADEWEDDRDIGDNEDS